MKRRPRRPRYRDPFHTAAWVYALFGIAVVLVTVATPEMLRPERRSDLIQLIIGLPLFLLFALAIGWGDRAAAALLRWAGRPADRALRRGRWLREMLVMVLALSALARTLLFAANGLGWRPRVALRPLSLVLERGALEPRMLLAAALMAVILTTLVRVSWLPWLRRRRR